MRYIQDGYIIKGPGLPEQGVCAVGPAELEAAFEAGRMLKSAMSKNDCCVTGWYDKTRPDGMNTVCGGDDDFATTAIEVVDCVLCLRIAVMRARDPKSTFWEVPAKERWKKFGPPQP